MPSGIVTNGVILQVLGGAMRKFKPRQPRSLRFRLLVILAGALLLLAAFAPCANAQALIRYYDMEGLPVNDGYHVNLDSHAPAIETGAPGTTLVLDNGMDGAQRMAYDATNTSQQAGIPMNVPNGAGPNLTSIGFNRSGRSNLGVEILFPPSQFTGMYNVTSVSFAYQANGNGWNNVVVQLSTNGGTTFTSIAITSTALPATGLNGATINITIPAGLTLGVNNLALRLLFTGGQSNGTDLQFQLDNIQIGGTVPEPATVAGGLLGVLGLCWFQRRRLIRSVRFRRT
jgi:hypothetical protein